MPIPIPIPNPSPNPDPNPNPNPNQVQRYLHAARHLSACPLGDETSGDETSGLGRFGFRLFEGVATAEEIAALLAFVETVTD